MESLSLKWHYLRLYLPNVQFYAQFIAFCHTQAIVYNLQLKIILSHTYGTNEQFERLYTNLGTIRLEKHYRRLPEPLSAVHRTAISRSASRYQPFGEPLSVVRRGQYKG